MPNIQPYTQMNCTAFGKITIHAVWNSPSGQLPPPSLTLAINAGAGWSASSSSTPFSIQSHSTDNGLGDAPEVFTTYGPSSFGGVNCNAKPVLATVNSMTGIVDYPITLSANMQFMTTMTGASGSLACNCRAVVDNRYVGITVPTNYYRALVNDVPTQAVNIQMPYGVNAGDTLCADPAYGLGWVTINYQGSDSANWHPLSSYLYNTANQNLGQSGFFVPTGIPQFPVTYQESYVGGSVDLVTLKAIDSNDGAASTAAFVMRFHAPYENWKEKGRRFLLA